MAQLWRQEIDRNARCYEPVRRGHTEGMPEKRWPRKRRRNPTRMAPAAGRIPEWSAAPLPDADDDRRASVRMQLAALMLRRGDDVGDVAVATDVPVAMLDLLRGEVADEADLNQQRRAAVHYARRRRRVVAAVLIIEVAAVANIILCITALIRHDAGLGILASLIPAALVLAVYAVAKYSTHTGYRTRYSRFAARRDGRDRGSGE